MVKGSAISVSSNRVDHVVLRPAFTADIDGLCSIEQECFQIDRLSRRSFKRHIVSEHSDLLVALVPGNDQPVAYGLSFRRKGTRLARLYSLAVSTQAQGKGLALALLQELEALAIADGRFYMRLEVAENNSQAISIYQKNGYRIFGEYSDYYEDHTDALRMQKRIRHPDSKGVIQAVPWYPQTTDFTCGPSALMMAMASLSDSMIPDQCLELDIWREATTIFMTSGHGGCHPYGLALAAKRRRFEAEVWLNSEEPLFTDGVRSDEKKAVMTTVHHQFFQACKQEDLPIHFEEVSQFQVEQWLLAGCAVMVLISTYRLDGRKAPHWVVITGIDSLCLYVNDPDIDLEKQQPIDCQHIPIAREDFDKMSMFGAGKLRCAIAIKPVKQKKKRGN